MKPPSVLQIKCLQRIMDHQGFIQYFRQGPQKFVWFFGELEEGRREDGRNIIALIERKWLAKRSGTTGPRFYITPTGRAALIKHASKLLEPDDADRRRRNAKSNTSDAGAAPDRSDPDDGWGDIDLYI